MHFQNFLEELDAIYEELPAAEAVKKTKVSTEEASTLSEEMTDKLAQYRVALADYEDDDGYDQEGIEYLLEPGQTKGDLVKHLSYNAGFIGIYVYDERVATPEEIKQLSNYTIGDIPSDPYYNYGEVDEEDWLDESLTEAAEEEEIEIVDDEIEITDNEAVEEEPKQVVLECSKCGALAIKTEADVVVDEASDLVNIEDACQYCEEAAGYTIVGAIAPYEATTEIVEEGLLGKKTEKTIKASEVKKGDKVIALDGEKFSRPSKVKEVNKKSDGRIDVFHKDGNFSTDANSTVTILESCDDKVEEGLFGKEVEKTIKASEVKKGDKIVAFDGDKLSKPSKVTEVEMKADIVNISHKNGTVGGGCDTPVTVLTKE